MPTVQSESKKALGIFCSDLHLSLHPPVWRSNEGDWFEAMLRPIEELKQLQDKLSCDIFFCGDLFNLWYGSAEKGAPELINFAMKNLPYMHCIPGQHDLPDHAIGEIQRTAYHTLANASVIHHLTKPQAFANGKLSIWPFPFDSTVHPMTNQKDKNSFDVALCHEYNWMVGHNYSGAPESQYLVSRSRCRRFKGYDFVFCGDNHSAFITRIEQKSIFTFVNCGTMIRRRSDEKNLHPCVWVLYDDGSITDHPLNILKDKHLDVTEKEYEKKIKEMDMMSFLGELNKLGYSGLDFAQALKEYFEIRKVDVPVRQVVMEHIPCQS